MDRFLIRSKLPQQASSCDHSFADKDAWDVDADILSLIQNSTNTTSAEREWCARNKSVSGAAIFCSEKNKELEYKRKTGWRVSGESKTYVTFRNGKRVQGTGYEGYKLFIGDSSNGKKKRQREEDEVHQGGTAKKIHCSRKDASDSSIPLIEAASSCRNVPLDMTAANRNGVRVMDLTSTQGKQKEKGALSFLAMVETNGANRSNNAAISKFPPANSHHYDAGPTSKDAGHHTGALSEIWKRI